MSGYWIVLRTLLRLWWLIVADVGNTVLVWLGFKRWPATGPAEWVERNPKPDLLASAWQRHLRPQPTGPPPCPHHDDANKEAWVMDVHVIHAGSVRPALMCTRCHAYRVVSPTGRGCAHISDWHQGVQPCPPDSTPPSSTSR